MSLKEERFDILDDDSGRLLIAEVVDSDLLLNDNRNSDLPRSGICVLKEKNFEVRKKEVAISEIAGNVTTKKIMTSNEYIPGYLYNCAICKNLCNNCKYICVTCKSPCKKCSPRSCKTSSTDTDDFQKYLESQTRKVKVQPKVKTVGTDTCDLEGHFDYYTLEKKTVRIQKDVATDCTDLNLRKAVVKKPSRNSVAVDTSDLNVKQEANDDSDCEFSWTETTKLKSSFETSFTEKVPLKNEGKPCDDDDVCDNSFNVEDDGLLEENDIKENFKTVGDFKEITFDSSESEESDIDLATSSKISKARQLAKEHKVTLKESKNKKEILFKCSICNESFHKKHLGVLHLGNHFKDDKFECLKCSEEFTSLELLFSHMKDTHSVGVSNNKKPNDSVKFASENNDNSKNLLKQQVNKIYQCALCSNENETAVTFDSYKALYLHKKLKHGIHKTKLNDREKTEKKPRIKREFICLLCGKQFKSSKALKDHSPVHTGEKNYHCDICNKSYTTNANLKIHKRTHTGARNFVCTVCNKAFHKKDSLKVHFRKHSGERPFQCDLCPMNFDRNYILKNHRYTHFSEKTFICPVCGKTFTTHGGLNNHEKSHKKDPVAKKPRKPAVKPTLDAENAVICDVCGKIYSTKSNLRIHKFVHSGEKPFECTICHQKYAKKDSMLTHMRKHTDERPFACGTCGMTFYRNHTLKTHLLRHTGERPHKCKMCGKSFTQSSSLAYHVKNHDRKVEKKKVVPDDPAKQTKKRVNQGTAKSGVAATKKVPKPLKVDTEYQTDAKPVLQNTAQKTVEGSSEITVVKGPLHLPEKEILILDKNLGVELPRSINAGKEIDFFSLEKDVSYNNQYSLSKFNYHIAKSHFFTFPKESLKSKTVPKEIEISVDKNVENVENLIISKNSYITKEGNLITLNRDSSLKIVKEEFVQIGDQVIDVKAQPATPITGEILNAAFISDENEVVIPFSSMTLQGHYNAENVMMSPLISVESDDRKAYLDNT